MRFHLGELYHLAYVPLQLKCRNAHGSHIYIRPAGEHQFNTLDDLSETSLARFSEDGFTPYAVVETSAANFQAWLKHPRVFPKLLLRLATNLGPSSEVNSGLSLSLCADAHLANSFWIVARLMRSSRRDVDQSWPSGNWHMDEKSPIRK